MSTVHHVIVLHEERKKRQAITPEQNAPRASSGSHFPHMYLSPFSKKQRKISTLKERKSLQHQVNSCTQSFTQIKLMLGRVIVTV